jgi:ribonucleoside-diphosphate reductase alpha chain
MKIKTLDQTTNRIVYSEVTDKWETNVESLDQRIIIFNDGSELKCSKNHPILIKKNDKFVQIYPDDLNKFDEIIIDSFDKQLNMISVLQDNRLKKHIDITVENHHTFFVSDNKDSHMILTHNSQGGVRGGAATLYYPLWHLEIEDMLVLKNNKGVEENRIRQLDYGVQFNKTMYERLLSGGNITLFSPHDVPEMYEAFFNDNDKFKDLYEKSEKNPNIRKKTVSAMDLFTLFLKERKDTGRIYLMNVDHVNVHGSFMQDIAPIRLSNLCCEITLPTKPLNDVNDPKGEVALCTLSSINWGKIRSPSDFERPCTLAVRALDELLDYQNYPLLAAKNATMNRRPLGVGIINLAFWLARNDLKYDGITDEGLQKLHEYTEAWSYYLIKASADLAIEKGQCPSVNETKYSCGILPIDTYKKDVDNIVKPIYKMPWNELRLQLTKTGIRNSTLMALMPAETSAQVSNSTNGIEPVRGLVSIKGSKDGVLKQIVPSVHRLKNKYDLLWEQKSPEGYLKICAVLQKFIDQSISVNTSYNPKHYLNDEIPMSILLKDVIDFYKMGGKCLYYFNTTDGAGEQHVELSHSIVEEEDCDGCKI